MSISDHIANERMSLLDLKMISVPQNPVAESAVAPPAPKSAARLNFGEIIRQIAVLSIIAGLSFGVYSVLTRYFIQCIEVVGESMVPTLAPGNHYLLNRWA